MTPDRQPDILPVSGTLRLKQYDGHYERFLAPYQDPYIYQNSEGILDDAKKPDLDYVRRMCEYLSQTGELYYIQVLENGVFVTVGDVTVKEENPPIAIWEARFRGRGIGTAVMRAVIDRLWTLGIRRVTGSAVYKWNLPSQRMHLGLGFQCVGENEQEFFYDLDIAALKSAEGKDHS